MRAEMKNGFSWKYLKTLPLNKKVNLGYATTALWDGEKAGVYHHNNQIAALTKETITITHRGWNSNSTRDRLDQILTDNYGYGVYRVNKHKGRISLHVKDATPVGFDTITLQRTGVTK
tara:strand:- start:724 stop:1077 length:354 start_codon:yes stop_codon:yes gene_type:complete